MIMIAIIVKLPSITRNIHIKIEAKSFLLLFFPFVYLFCCCCFFLLCRCFPQTTWQTLPSVAEASTCCEACRDVIFDERTNSTNTRIQWLKVHISEKPINWDMDHKIELRSKGFESKTVAENKDYTRTQYFAWFVNGNVSIDWRQHQMSKVLGRIEYICGQCFVQCNRQQWKSSSCMLLKSSETIALSKNTKQKKIMASETT